MSNPAVSVILPTRNRASLLPRAVSSVLAQSFADFELIVVDDASSDATPAVLASFTDPRIRVIRRAVNSGPAAARNAGLASARGTYVAFQDDDDVWLPHKLATQVAALESAGDEVGICFSAHLRWHTREYGATYIGGPDYTRPLDFSAGLNVNYGLIATPAWLVRRAVIERAGGFDENLRTQEDLDLAIRVCDVSRFVVTDEPLYIQDHVLGNALMLKEELVLPTLKIMLEKHGRRWEAQRRIMAQQYYYLGRLESMYGDCKLARQWFEKGMSYQPTHPKMWLGWLLARLGPRFVRGVTGFMRGVVRPFVYQLTKTVQ